MLNSFKVWVGSQVFDYRLGENLDLDSIKVFFQGQGYGIRKIWNGGRHAVGVLTKSGITYFLKLSTSEGISIVTKKEYYWNNYFNKYFPVNFPYVVPKNYDSGYYQDKYLYLITDYFEGEKLCDLNDIQDKSNRLTKYIHQIIELSELIQKLPFVNFTGKKYEKEDYRSRFISRVNNWFNDIPTQISNEFKVGRLLDIVEAGVGELLHRPRHGDFTPWHILKLSNSKLGLIDGEHALPDGVEYYDICYFIQRVFSVLKNPRVAQSIYSKLSDKGYNVNKLKTVLAARAIGGFLDESLKEKPDYKFANDFKDWIIKI